MRVAAVAIALLALGAPTTYAAVYDFTIELPASPGAGGRGVAPQQRLTFSLDTATAQVLTSNLVFSVFTVVPGTEFSPLPLTVFTYGTNETTITSSMLAVSPLILEFNDRSIPTGYILSSGLVGHPSMTALSSGTGTSITFPTGVPLPVTNLINEMYLRQDGTVFVTLEPATTVPEPGGWLVLGGALGVLCGCRRRGARSVATAD